MKDIFETIDITKSKNDLNISKDYKIVSVSEPKDELEKQQVDDCKNFNKKVVKIIWLMAGSMMSTFGMGGSTLLNYPISLISFCFMAVTTILSGSKIGATLDELYELYKNKCKEKNNVKNNDSKDEKNDLGGKTK